MLYYTVIKQFFNSENEAWKAWKKSQKWTIGFYSYILVVSSVTSSSFQIEYD